MDILSEIKSDAHLKKLSDYGNQSKKINKGKILRVKPGYNPNSSSMGSIVYAFPKIMLGLSVVFGVVSGLIVSKFMKREEESGRKKLQKTKSK